MRRELVIVETIQSGAKRIRAEELTIPDVRWIALCLSPRHRIQTFFAYKTAVHLLADVMARDPTRRVTCPMNVDVPQLWLIARNLPREEKKLMTELWSIFTGLVRHLIPEPEVSSYSGGTRYIGFCWLTLEQEK